MSNRPPLIGVGMPVYNREQYVGLAIESVLAQTFGDFELVISDNASSDQTEAICRDYAARDDRIVYIRNQKNIGAAGNFNLLFHRSSSPFFRWFNSDDLSSPRLHEKCLEALQAYPDAAVSYGKTDIIDYQGRLIKHYDDRLNLQQESTSERFLTFRRVVGMTNIIYGLMRRTALTRTNLMGNATFPAADTNLMGELALHGKVIEIPETLFYRRMHEQASSWGFSNQSEQQRFWTGNHSKFVMPTFKKEYAYWKAISRSSAGWPEKMRMKAYILKCMNESKRDIIKESLQEITNMLNRPELHGDL